MKIKKHIILILIIVFFASGCAQEDKVNNSVRPKTSASIVVYGDSRNGHEAHRKIVNQIIEFKPVAVFHTGDLVGDGKDANDWQIFNQITDKMMKATKFYPALGNHEKESDLYFKNFVLPNNERWYSVDTEGIHFIVLDSTKGIREDSKQYEWLIYDLKKTKKADFVAAVLHHPAYNTGKHEEDQMNLREKVVPLFKEYDVDIVFSGHDHSYERSLVDGIYFLVTGGGGAPLYQKERERDYSQVFKSINHFCLLRVAENRIEIKVYDTDLNIIDTFSVNR